jgi:hypothetical protein
MPRKTLVIGINLHGEMPLDGKCEPEMIKVPNNYIIKLNTVAPGVPNISTIENYNNLGDIVKRFVKENKWLNDPMESARLKKKYKTRMLKFVTELKEKFIEENAHNIAGIESEYFKKGVIPESHKHKKDFIHNTDRMYGITEFGKDDVIENKLFSKFSPEQIEQYGIDEDQLGYDKGFNKIVIYNFEDAVTQDLFEMLNMSFGLDLTEITLFDLIDLFTNMSVENLILIDLSCSTFKSDKGLTSRTTRCLRREIMKSNVYDGKTLNYRKKMGKIKKGRKTKRSRGSIF